MKEGKESIKFNEMFLEFIDYLIQLDYGEERGGFIEGVMQRAFFDEWVKFLAYKKDQPSPFESIKDSLLD